MTIPMLIYCAGKNRAFESVALAAGFQLGVRLPGMTYHPIVFADQDWRQPDRSVYMAALTEHRPQIATVLDLERPEQRADVLCWAEEAAQYVERVIIIPKYFGAIIGLPRRIGGADVVLGYSVPTKHGGTPISPHKFAGWPVHLLGGSPQMQMRLWRYLRTIAEVVSVDGNMMHQQAHHCRFWSVVKGAKGHWVQLAETGDMARGNDANLRAFRRSCENIVAAWHLYQMEEVCS
jgi:hypothetical protein